MSSRGGFQCTDLMHWMTRGLEDRGALVGIKVMSLFSFHMGLIRLATRIAHGRK